MLFKIILGAIIGGALMLGAGFVEHEMLHWGDRHMKNPKDVSNLINSVKADCQEPGIYYFPKPPLDMANKPAEEQKKVMEQLGEEYKAGRYGFVVAPKPITDFSVMNFLTYEGVSNVVACLLASIVVAMTRPSIGFIGRWFVVVVIGLFGWASVNASYYIWYHFPLEFLQDELMCAALEAALAGVAIAAIVVPRERMNAGF